MFSKKKQYKITPDNKERIDYELDQLTDIGNGIYSKVKEFELGYYIKIILDLKKLNINKEEKQCPDLVTFLIIVDYSYPENSPKILSKTSVYNIYNI